MIPTRPIVHISWSSKPRASGDDPGLSFEKYTGYV